MGEWSIYGSNGSQKATVKKLEYSGEFMGETHVTCDVYAPSPISFGVGDYLEYRGERFVIDYDATRKKQARVNTYGSGFLYEGMRFISYVGELKKCEFLDFVPSDNQIHYSQLPEFSFFAADVSDLADRIQANLDRLYTGNKAWTVSVAQGFEGKTNIDVQVSKITCFDALKLAYDQFEAQFVIRGRVITIGTAGSTLETNYKYGKGNGLKTIERSVDESDALITRLRAYGNTTNMPANYYRNLNTLCYADYYETLGPYADNGADLHFHPGGNKFANNWFTEKSGADAGHYWVEVSLDEDLWITAIASTNAGNGGVAFSVISTGMYGSNTQDMLEAFNTQLGSTGRLYFRKGVSYDNWGAGKESGSSVPASLFIDRLMLPSFPTNPDPYIDSSNIGTLGVREKSVYFDGSDPELPDIHPSLEGMTAHDIDPIHGSLSDYLDEIAADATEIGGGEITNDGQFVNVDEVPGFQVKIKDIGFDINSYLSTETATLCMKSGKCGGREFTIVKVEKAYDDNVFIGYTLTCQRTEDINLYFPYKDYPIKAGDKFVLTGIEMPEIYVTAASNRLLAAAQEYLEKHSQPQYVYAIKMDDIWMQRQADGCEDVEDSYYWNIKEGDVMQVQDVDLGIYEGTAQSPTPISEVIDRLTIREGYDPILQIEVVLRKEKPQGTIGILQNKIRQLEQVNAEQMRTISRQSDYITYVLGDRLNDIMNQSDKQQISWFGTTAPFAPNTGQKADYTKYPVTEWGANQSQREASYPEHIGDMYYDKSVPAGYVFEKDGNTYKWATITDPHTLQALAIASEDKDTLDGKRRVFVTGNGELPVPPYEEGDLWVNAVYPEGNTKTDASQDKYYNDILRCITHKEKGEQSDIAHWSLASKYNLSTDKGNLLLNSGFTGEYESETPGSGGAVNPDTPMYSDPFKYWETSGVTVSDNSEMTSGKAATLTNGRMKQTLGALKAGYYALSFNASITDLVITFCGQYYVPTVSEAIRRYEWGFELASDVSSGYILISGSGVISDIMLTKGSFFGEWKPSNDDNAKELAATTALEYLENAINNASTDILGGLVLTQMIKVGNYRLDQSTGKYSMGQETGGMSGLMNDGNSPYLWGGGTLEQAIYTICKYVQNPAYQASDAEVAQMAKFVVTHGGRAILNDIILRGYIYAKGGVFNGTVYARNGVFSGTVNANLFYSPIKEIDGTGGYTTYNIDPQNDPYRSFIVYTSASDYEHNLSTHIVLPNANSYSGMELQIFHSVLAGRPQVEQAYIDTTSSDSIVINGDAFSSMIIPQNTLITLKSMEGDWYYFDYVSSFGGEIRGDLEVSRTIDPSSGTQTGGAVKCNYLDCGDIDARDITARTIKTHDYEGNVKATIDGNGDVDCYDIDAQDVTADSFNSRGDVGVAGEIYKSSSSLKLQESVNKDIRMCYGGGTVYCGNNIVATSYDAPSDERRKIKRGDITLSLDDIANAPSVLFNWKHIPNGEVVGGTIAQYWQKVAPWAVSKDKDGMLSVSYGTLALSCVIAVARYVRETVTKLAKRHNATRKEIKELRKEVQELRDLIGKR